MKILISIFMILTGSVLCAQNSKLETIYSQIPPIPDKLLCECADNHSETIALLESLSALLEEMRPFLNEEMKNSGDETYNTISAGFPTAEEMERVEKLSEAEQRAFWAKIEDDQNRIDKAIAGNNMKYQAERETMDRKVADYQHELLSIMEELSIIHPAAMKVKSDKRQNIYNSCIENNTLNEYGKKQMEEISIEFCSVVSPVYLKRLRLEYDNLQQNMSLYRRLTIIEIAEFSTLTEDVIIEQNDALLDLNDLEILAQFITNYRVIFDILPGAIDNQTYNKY